MSHFLRNGAIAASAVAMVAAPVVAQSERRATISEVEQHLAQTRSLSANFTQTNEKNQSFRGTLALKRPGKIKFDFGTSANMTLVSENDRLYFLDYDVNQKDSWSIRNSPLSVLLESNPDLDRIAEVLPTNDPRVVLVKARDARRPEFGTLILSFTKSSAGPAGLRLEGWVAIDAQGKRTNISLSGQRYNGSIPDSRFAYRDID
ncbi:LolA family protein [Sphingomicrobium sediminis]|uniref:Outer membrane lipoprotein carrier protein LolA n=1 Tax=Sphingomicrobium sediminis TaxID=2950949 RepID=A0A9X2EIC4_9SPHN|nr:outer membrane lipoprotein carrier protein LolA [Sphingomicrobium sediminis]MCM8558065.1 outer membrane lipoprotein carrier protein LolA [Sphingomicrobium sediminis]